MKLINISLAIALFSLLQACGVAIHSSGSHDSPPDYISYKIYEVYSNNRTEFIYSDCINLDNFSDDEGTVHIDTPYVGEDLVMKWDHFGGDITFTFEDNFTFLYAASYDTYYFRDGGFQRFDISTGFHDYRITLDGPYCL
ncbi:hypothetical protein [Pseudobacteriovorax antillogorgiicola]|uniref:Lipoprotein n=1 Tax=Pseudobacteriovorax antillogorgiicola TaxID=1513793 RepID=A0A1Y6C7Z8_9BACT|nr:hypothetical protein [Pseudobacteriovorax antillogorgiicola]TCS51752.1 hypothetical protein EDD56_110137 [Pseudobacteriovorax antillogorgiicola]SMF49715.1 hypothetical protein SAMN06296036_115106 [Pseudobacteriovorax antillogorgiicola]